MSGQHKHSPLRFRPPEVEREWLEARAEQTGEPLNAILTAAVRALMSGDAEKLATLRPDDDETEATGGQS